MPMKATPTRADRFPQDVPVARAVTLQTRQAVNQEKEWGEMELQPEVDDHGDRCRWPSRPDQDADGQHDEMAGRALPDALDDALLHLGPGEFEDCPQAGRSRESRPRSGAPGA